MSREAAARTAALVALLALATALRFTHIDWGLRHPPHPDERVFVESARGMLQRGDFDPRYQEYPALLPYLLRLVLTHVPDGVESYRVARRLVAGFGVLDVALVFWLGLRLLGPREGLIAALLLAVSPVAVETAHMLRPDVLLQAAVTLALLAIVRVGPRGDALAGAAMSLAGAIKFSGIFLAPSYLAQRWLSPGPRWRGVMLATGAALLVYVVASPTSFQLLDLRGGLDEQVGHHYLERPKGAVPYPEQLGQYALVWTKALGWPGALLAVLGVVMLRREWRSWLPVWLLPATTILVMSTSDYRFDRHLLPSLGVPLAMLAAALVRLLPRPVPLAAAALLVASFPARASLAYLQRLGEVSTRDQVADWIAREATPGSLVLSGVELLSLDEGRVEVLEAGQIADWHRPQVLAADLVLATPDDSRQALQGLELVGRFDDDGLRVGPTIEVFRVRRLLRAPLVPLTVACTAASDSGRDAHLACDGRLDTAWRTSRPQAAFDWFEMRLDAPARVARVELVLGEFGRFAGRDFKLLASPDGAHWRDVGWLPGRARPDDQQAPRGPHSQVLLVPEPVEARALRVQLTKAAARRWAIAEARLEALPGVADAEDAPPAPQDLTTHLVQALLSARRSG